MRPPPQIGLREPSRLRQDIPETGAGGRGSEAMSSYLTTDEAAAYLRRSPSWLLRQHDIPYVRGVPNTYRRKDLDDWFERHKCVVRVA